MREADVIIVGAGPAGLTAALYAARYCRSTLVVHDDTSRLDLISQTHNVPAFPGGISGRALLARMTGHAKEAGACITTGHILAARANAQGFDIVADDGRHWTSRTLILATGVHSQRLRLAEGDHDAAVLRGVLRYCPICDGYEHRDRRIAVAGNASHAVDEALFLRTYSATITLVPCDGWQASSAEQERLARAGIELLQSSAPKFRYAENAMLISSGRTETRRFDAVYAALGTRMRGKLAEQLGLPLGQDGQVADDAPARTEVSGLFCIGDMVAGLDQICIAAAHGATAATHSHNWLREIDGQ